MITPGRYRATRFIAKIPIFFVLIGILTVMASPVAMAMAEEPSGEVDSTSDEATTSLITDAIQKYQSLASYQDRISMKFTIISKDEDGDEWPQEHESEGTFAFARPNRFTLITDEMSAVCDGKQLYMYLKQFGQYTVNDAPKDLALDEHMMPGSMGSMPVHPVAMLLTSNETDLLKIVPVIKGIDRTEAEERHGRLGHRVHGRIEVKSMPIEEPVPFSVWIDAETKLVHEVRFDMTDGYKKMSETAYLPDEDEDAFRPPVPERAEMVISLDKIVLNAEIPDDRFKFEPDGEAKKVTEFMLMGFGQSAQLELIGKPAPEISGTDIDGKAIVLSELKGKILVLDFWATWCSPCVQALPHVQGVADKYKEKPVVVLGINRDGEGMEKAVRKLLAKKKVTFRQYMDKDSTVGEAYHISGIPCTALIDGKGVLQDIEVGYGPGGEDALSEKIDKLLKGESIHDPNELAARIAEMKAFAEEDFAEGDDDQTHAVSADLTDFVPKRLVEGKKIHAQASGWQSKRFDLDGDGRPELILPDWQGGLTIISDDGSEHRRMRFKGSGSGTSLRSFEPVRDGGNMYWVASFSRHGGTGMSEKGSVSLYDGEGKRLWSYKPELPKKVNSSMSVTTGDLTGDGRFEIIVSMSTYKARKTGSNSWSHENPHGYLLVFDSDGNRLCQRRVGGRVEQINAMPSSEAGGRATIVCAGDGKIRRFQFDMLADSVGDEEGAGKREPRAGDAKPIAPKEESRVEERNDPMARMERARELIKRGERKQALAEFLWCFDEGARNNPAFVGVRCSFLPSEIAKLGRDYPPALDALRERRDAVQARVDKGGTARSNTMLLMDLAALNQNLGDGKRNVELYDNLKASQPDSPILDFLRQVSADDLEKAGRLVELSTPLHVRDDVDEQSGASFGKNAIPEERRAQLDHHRKRIRPTLSERFLDVQVFARELESAQGPDQRFDVFQRRWDLVKLAVGHCNVVSDSSFSSSLAYWQTGFSGGWALRTDEDLKEPVTAKRKNGVLLRGDCFADLIVDHAIVHIYGDLGAQVTVSGHSEVIIGGNILPGAVIRGDGIIRIFVGGNVEGSILNKGSSTIWVNGNYVGDLATGHPSTDLHVMSDFRGTLKPRAAASLLNINVRGFMSTRFINRIAQHGYTQFRASVGVGDQPPGLYSSPNSRARQAQWVVHSQKSE